MFSRVKHACIGCSLHNVANHPTSSNAKNSDFYQVSQVSEHVTKNLS